MASADEDAAEAAALVSEVPAALRLDKAAAAEALDDVTSSPVCTRSAAVWTASLFVATRSRPVCTLSAAVCVASADVLAAFAEDEDAAVWDVTAEAAAAVASELAEAALDAAAFLLTRAAAALAAALVSEVCAAFSLARAACSEARAAAADALAEPCSWLDVPLFLKKLLSAMVRLPSSKQYKLIGSHQTGTLVECSAPHHLTLDHLTVLEVQRGINGTFPQREAHAHLGNSLRRR